jgi:putative flippase GtrA
MDSRFIRFLASGGSAAVIEYSTFTFLQMCGGRDWLLLSQPLSFAAGFVVSFLLNRSWVFRSSGVIHTELLKYGLIAMVNLAAGEVMIVLLAGPFRLNPFLSKFLVMALIAGWNYLLFSKLVFKPRAGEA